MSAGILRGTAAGFALLICVAACDPVMGSGSGNPPNLSDYIRSDAAAQSVVITLIAGYPAGDYQFNYNGYANGVLVVTVPVGWRATVQCENRGTVPNSCSVVAGRRDAAPVRPDWSTPDPARGLDPGQSSSFEFDPTQPGSYRVASLVDGHQASGMWADLEVPAGGQPSLAAPGA
ncbi:MAG TPA: sulfocyanin-like copper-binding protein [Myxococcaceae bacterium]